MTEPERKPLRITLLAPPPDVCQKCAVKHDERTPHDNHSLHFQYWFKDQHGRYPTWADAMAHCDADTQAFWKQELIKLGVWTE